MCICNISMTFICVFSSRHFWHLLFLWWSLQCTCAMKIIILPRKVSIFQRFRVTNNKWKWSICFFLFFSFGRLTMYKSTAARRFNSFHKRKAIFNIPISTYHYFRAVYIKNFLVGAKSIMILIEFLIAIKIPLMLCGLLSINI